MATNRGRTAACGLLFKAASDTEGDGEVHSEWQMVWGWQWQTKGARSLVLLRQSQFARQRQDRGSEEVMFVLRHGAVRPALGCPSPRAACSALLEGS